MRHNKYKRKLIYRDWNGYERYYYSWKLLHRHVIEMRLGRKLRSGEVAHHKNRNTLDNRRSNLIKTHFDET